MLGNTVTLSSQALGSCSWVSAWTLVCPRQVPRLSYRAEPLTGPFARNAAGIKYAAGEAQLGAGDVILRARGAQC